MKNPFEKENHAGLIITVAVTAAAAGVMAYLYLTESGSETRASVAHKLKDEAKNFLAGIASDKTGIRKSTLKKVADHIVK